MVLMFMVGLASATAGIAQWELTGSLNYVHPSLNEQFQVDDSYTLIVEVNDGVQAIGTDRRFFDSVGRFDDAILGGSLVFDNGYMMQLQAPVAGSFNMVNAGSASTSGYDQLNLSFQTFDDSLIGDPVAGNDPANLSVSFTDDEPPLDMLKGTEAAFPAYDLPFPNPQTFSLEQSTNERFHLRLQFTGGQPEGTQFVRGSVNEFRFLGEGNPPDDQPVVEENVVSNLTIQRGEAGSLVLTWDGNGLAPVIVERSGDLSSWEPWITIPAGGERELVIDSPAVDGEAFYRLVATAVEILDDFATESIADTILSLTIGTSTDENVEIGEVDTLKWNADGTFTSGGESGLESTSFEYTRINGITGKIDFVFIEEGNEFSGTITLHFTSSDSGTFELAEGELQETGSFTLREKTDITPPDPVVSIPTGSFDVLFDYEITTVEEGALVVAPGATMQATLPEGETLGTTGQELVRIDLDGERGTIGLFTEGEVLGETQLVPTPDQQAFNFEIILEEDRAPIGDGFYGQSTERLMGNIHPSTGAITMELEERYRLSWDIDARTSLLRAVWSYEGRLDP